LAGVRPVRDAFVVMDNGSARTMRCQEHKCDMKPKHAMSGEKHLIEWECPRCTMAEWYVRAQSGIMFRNPMITSNAIGGTRSAEQGVRVIYRDRPNGSGYSSGLGTGIAIGMLL